MEHATRILAEAVEVIPSLAEHVARLRNMGFTDIEIVELMKQSINEIEQEKAGAR